MALVLGGWGVGAGCLEGEKKMHDKGEKRRDWAYYNGIDSGVSNVVCLVYYYAFCMRQVQSIGLTGYKLTYVSLWYCRALLHLPGQCLYCRALLHLLGQRLAQNPRLARRAQRTTRAREEDWKSTRVCSFARDTIQRESRAASRLVEEK